MYYFIILDVSRENKWISYIVLKITYVTHAMLLGTHSLGNERAHIKAAVSVKCTS
jgi:hypothetical protein